MADRRRDPRAQPAAGGRSNEYFVPKDGIDREVITADICRYLGNDALVRPGVYENPQTRARQEGYFINAYRNLTSAMIQDLKADSARWETERRQSASRSNVGYKNSATHESRQYYGPTEASHAPSGYVSAAPVGNSQTVYDGSFQPQSSYAQPPAGYGAQPQYVNDSNYFVSGAHMEIDGPAPRQRAPVPVSGPSVPGSNAGYAQPRSAIFPEEQRNPYYSQPPVSSASQYSSQPADYNGRVPASYQQQPGQQYDPEYSQDSRYAPQGGYSQPPDGSYSPASANPPRRTDRDRDPDPRDSRRRHHGGR